MALRTYDDFFKLNTEQLKCYSTTKDGKIYQETKCYHGSVVNVMAVANLKMPFCFKGVGGGVVVVGGGRLKFMRGKRE